MTQIKKVYFESKFTSCSRLFKVYSISNIIICLVLIVFHLFAAGCESWPVRKENEVALQQAEMKMSRWMCGIKVKDRFPSKEPREGLGIDDIILVLQQKRLR